MKVTWDFSELTEFADRLNDFGRFEEFAKRATKEIAEALLKLMKANTPVETSELLRGWDDASKIVVTKKNDGFEVILVNRTKYALWVNDGHKSKNQFGGPYEIKRRIKVTSPHKWQKGDQTWYVFGHFFVERGIEQLANSKQIEQLLYKQLQQWWKGCF